MATGAYRRYLDPAVLSKVSGLAARARRVVEGHMAGIHRSPYHGLNVEFAEHLPYSPGHELKQIDWKLWARSDRFYVKLFEAETNVRAHFLVDASGSMAYRSGAMSKYDCAATLAASLAYLLLAQQDAVALTVMADGVRAELPPRASLGHLDEFCRVLERERPEGPGALGRLLQQAADRLRRRSMVVVVSDFLAPLEDAVAALRRLSYEGHAAVFIHVADADEEEFPFDRNVRFEGLEGGAPMLTDAAQVRSAYLESFRAFQRELEGACREAGCDYVYARTDRPLDVTLGRLLRGGAGL